MAICSRFWCLKIVRFIELVMLASISIGATVGTGQAQQQDELRRIYEQILGDPGNADLNRRYAQLVINRGELRKAIAAYERILARDPKNKAALRGLRRVRRLLKPNVTTATAVVGAQAESNPRRVSAGLKRRVDGVFFFQGLISHTRRLGDVRWSFDADLYANYHLIENDLDFGNISARTGPIIAIGKSSKVHLFAGAAYSWFDYRTFFIMPEVGLRFEFDKFGPLQFITIRGTYSFINESLTSRGAITVDITPRFVFKNLFGSKIVAVASPYWRYNGVTGSGSAGVDQRGEAFPQRFHQLGFRADLFMRVRRNVTASINFSAEYRHFFETVVFGTKQRRDVLYSPGAQLIIAGIFGRNLDLIFSYKFEWNSSNDGVSTYTNQIAGIRLLARF